MPNYDNMPLEELLTLKWTKEAELSALRGEIREIARVEEKIARTEELRRKIGDGLSPEDLAIIQNLAQTTAPAPIESQETMGQI